MTRHGFTMIELLATACIIVVLAGLLLFAVVVVRRHTRKMTAQSEVKNLEMAWRQYYAQYQKWPSFAEEDRAVAVIDTVAQVLQGSGGGNDNPMRLVFTQFSRFDRNTNPVNPWGQAATIATACYYYVKFDLDYDKIIHADVDGGCPSQDVRSPVIVWTYNPDVSASDPGYVVGSW